MKLARIKIETGLVENIIQPYAPPSGFIEVEIPDDSPVQKGYAYDDQTGQFIAPPSPDEAAN